VRVPKYNRASEYLLFSSTGSSGKGLEELVGFFVLKDIYPRAWDLRETKSQS